MDKLQLTTLKVCPFFPQKFRLFIDMSPSFAFLHRSGFLISHHGSFMGGALPCWTWIVSWLCKVTGCCSVSLRIEKELIPFQETSTIGPSEKSLSYAVEHQVGYIIDSFNCTTPFDVSVICKVARPISLHITHIVAREKLVVSVHHHSNKLVGHS